MKIEDLYNDLVKTIGDDKVSYDPVEIALHSIDSSSYYFDLDADDYKNYILVKPSSEKEIQNIVNIALKYRTPIIPQGSSTSLAMGSGIVTIDNLLQFNLVKNAIILNLSNMNRLISISKTDQFVEVEPGVRIDELNRAIKKYNLFFPIDPASSRVASIGGAISTGAGGLRGARYGTMRNWVLGLRFIDGLGRLHRVGCYTIKCRQGLDITRLMVGSEGVLGIITRAILKLWPLPKNILRFLIFFDEFIKAYKLFINIRSIRQPLVAEYIEDRIVESISKSLGIKLPYGHMILIDIDLEDDKDLERISRIIHREAERLSYIEIFSASNKDPEFDELYRIRRSMFPSVLRMRRKRHIIVEDTVIPISRIPEFIDGIKNLEKEFGENIYIGGHLGDGNLHPHLECNLNDPEDRSRILNIASKIALKALELMGSVSAEHGIGSMKLELLVNELKFRNSEHTIDIMKGIKKVFDPYNILNPGRVIPNV